MFPSISEYNQVILQRGSNAFRSLGDVFFLSARTSPIKIFSFGSGSYAVIFKANQNGNVLAIRCFIAAEQETISRYISICNHLKTVNASWKTDFELLENEIKVSEKYYPILKMEWVDGVLINKFIEANLYDNDNLLAIQNQLVEISNSLERNGVGHGDLQSGNIIVKTIANGFQIKLIDYDGMFVPALASKRSLEKGRSEFQHPGRTLDYFNSAIDRFSIWVMLTAIEALKFDKTLWKETMQGGFNNLDNFLFLGSDFQNPERSALFNRLSGINSPSLKFYIEQLKKLSKGSFSNITKPVLYGHASDLVPQPLRSVSTPFTDEITITSIPAGASVLTSALQKLGEAPMRLSRQQYNGKTLVILSGDSVKRITVEFDKANYEVYFLGSKIPVSSAKENIQQVPKVEKGNQATSNIPTQIVFTPKATSPRKEEKNTYLAPIIIAILFLGCIAFLIFNYWQKNQATSVANNIPVPVVDTAPLIAFTAPVDSSLFNANDITLLIDSNPSISLAKFPSEEYLFNHPEWQVKSQFIDLDNDNIYELLTQYFNPRTLHCCSIYDIYTQVSKNKYQDIFRFEGGEGALFFVNNEVQVNIHDQLSYFYSNYGYSISSELPNPNFEPYFTLIYTNQNLVFDSVDTNLNRAILENLDWLKNRIIPDLDSSGFDDGTRKAFAEHIITYYFNTNRDIDQTKYIFETNYLGADSLEIWQNITEHIVGIMNMNVTMEKYWNKVGKILSPDSVQVDSVIGG